LDERLSVERLADQAAMSPRHFARAFMAETGITPAKAIERLRLEAARERVESSADPIEGIAFTPAFAIPNGSVGPSCVPSASLPRRCVATLGSVMLPCLHECRASFHLPQQRPVDK